MTPIHNDVLLRIQYNNKINYILKNTYTKYLLHSIKSQFYRAIPDNHISDTVYLQVCQDTKTCVVTTAQKLNDERLRHYSHSEF